MQFIVPKFIEREMRIVGSLTMKLFIIILVFVAIMALLYFSLPRKVFFIIAAILVPSFVASFFVKVDGTTPLYQLYPSLFSFLFSPKVFVWKGRGKVEEVKFEKETQIPLQKKSKLSDIQTTLKIKK